MIGLVLAAGKGSRLGLYRNKCMLEIKDRSLIYYSLSRLSEICDKIIIVVGYKGKEIQFKYGTRYNSKPLEYIVQPNHRKGIVEAIDCAKYSLVDDFYLSLGDEILINSRHKEMKEYFLDSNLFGIVGTCKGTKQEIKKTYSLLLSNNGYVHDLIEKPVIFFNDYIGTGNIMFRKEILQYIYKVPINPVRKEKELVDLIKVAINNNKIFKTFNICEKYFNINTKEDLLEAKRYLEK